MGSNLGLCARRVLYHQVTPVARSLACLHSEFTYPSTAPHSILHTPGSSAPVYLIGEKPITQLCTHAGMSLSQVHVLSTEKEKKNPNIRTCQVLIWVKRKRKKSQLGCHDLGSDGWLSCKRNNQKPELPRSMTGLLSRHRQKQEREEWPPQEVGLAG